MLTLHRIRLAAVCLSVAAVGCTTGTLLGDNIDGSAPDHSGGKAGGTGGVGSGGSSGGDGGVAGSGGTIPDGSGGSNTGGVVGAATGGAGTGGTAIGGAGTGGAATGGAGGIGGGSAGGRGSGGASAGSSGGGASGSGGAGGGTITYAGCSFVGGVNRVVIAKRDTARDLCVVLVLDSPGSNPFNLTLPQNTGMEFAYAMPAQADCRQRIPPTGAASAVAGTGSVVSFPTPQPTYSVDVTFTFQPNASIGVGASERLMVNNVLAGLGCP
jgi:hypothetical protein